MVEQNGAFSGRRPEVYIRVIHADSPAASRVRGKIADTLSDVGHVEVQFSVAERATLQRLRAETQMNADVWIALSDKPLGETNTEVALVPLASNSSTLDWLAEIQQQLNIHNIHSGQTGYQEWRRLGVPSVLFYGIPWDQSNVVATGLMASTGIAPAASDADVISRAAHAAVAEYETLMTSLTKDGLDIPSSIREGILDHFRTRLAGLWNCTDEVIPENLRELIDDDIIRQFVRSALCVERLASEYFDPASFDFALPGSGLWRAFERALNLSVVAAVRREAGIVSTDPLVADGPKARTLPRSVIQTGQQAKSKDPQFAHLGNFDPTPELRGLSLGAIGGMLRWARAPLPLSTRVSYVSVVSALTEYVASAPNGSDWDIYVLGDITCAPPCSSELSTVIARVQHLRNPPSHIEYMGQDSFEELRGITLGAGHLGKALQLARLWSARIVSQQVTVGSPSEL